MEIKIFVAHVRQSDLEERATESISTGDFDRNTYLRHILLVRLFNWPLVTLVVDQVDQAGCAIPLNLILEMQLQSVRLLIQGRS